MLVRDNLVEKMKRHFPRWMNIRKRVETSSGGAILTSIAEEIAEIQDAINDYKKDFFLANYIGKEDDVIYYIYAASIGNVEADNLNVSGFSITTDIKAFYETEKAALFEDGILYFKPQDVSENYIDININGSASRYELEIKHVWNVFDEFAAFVGLVRYTGESNSELTNRMLNVFKRPENGTAIGIKNAIINALSNIEEVSPSEIVIERPSPENIIKYYNDFTKIIDIMNDTNRDVLSKKRWDLDLWKHDFAKVDYLPHAWDLASEEAYVNGIGFADDLKVELLDEEKVTNATISFYVEEEDSIKNYLSNNNADHEINIKAKELSGLPKVHNVSYKITASDYEEINTNNITIETKQMIKEKNTYKISDFINDNTIISDAAINSDYNKLAQNGEYSIVLTPKSDRDYVHISKCEVKRTIDGTATKVNLINSGDIQLKSNNELANFSAYYSKDEKGILSKNISAYYTMTEQLETSNAINGINGIEIENLSSQAVLRMPKSNNIEDSVIVSYGCPKKELNISYIELDNEEANIPAKIINENTLNLGNGKAYLTIDANEISFFIQSGECAVRIIEDGVETTSTYAAPYFFTTSKSATPKRFELEFTSASGTSAIITNFEYTLFSLTEGDDDDDASLYKISMESFAGFKPYISSILVGNKPDTDHEIIISFNGNINDEITLVSNCDAKLYRGAQEVSNSEKYLYRTVSKDTEAQYPYIKLALPEYEEITHAYAIYENGNREDCEITKEENIPHCIIRPSKNDKISEIFINGIRLFSNKTLTLSEVLGINSSGKHVYASKIFDGFLIYNPSAAIENMYQFKQITRSLLNILIVGKVSIKNLNAYNLECVFVTKTGNRQASFVTDTINGDFEYVYLYPKGSSTYVAYNEINTTEDTVMNINMVKNFRPMLPRENGFSYKIEAINNPNCEPVFMSTGMQYCIENNNIKISKIFNKNDDSVYDFTVYNIKFPCKLTGTTVAFDTININGVERDPAELLLELDEGYKFVYADWSELDEDQKQNVDMFHSGLRYVVQETYPANKITKLKHRNVQSVIIKRQNETIVPDSAYTLHNELGLIVWKQFVTGALTIEYFIKRPTGIEIPISELYRIIDKKVLAYKHKSENDIKISNISSGFVYHLDDIDYDKITVSCSDPGWIAILDDNRIVFSNNSKTNSIAIKSGYYYFDNTEYYLFADYDPDNETINRHQNVLLLNAKQKSNKLILNKESINYVKNSSMQPYGMGKVHEVNFNEIDIQGTSKLNAITACSDFNSWETFGATLSPADGFNGVGIKISPTTNGGYAMINITDSLQNGTNFLSFYAEDTLKCYIGFREKYSDDSIRPLIKVIQAIQKHSVIDHLYECQIEKADGEYYLIVTENGIIDDIIINTTSPALNGLHTKNINHFKFDIQEKTDKTKMFRMRLTDNNKYSNAEFSNGVFRTDSTIHWGLTKIKEFSTLESFSKSVLQHVDIQDGLVSSEFIPGTIETEPVLLDDLKTIKFFGYKINDVEFNNMIGFTVKILTSQEKNGQYNVAAISTSNTKTISAASLLPYVKLIIEMPLGKIINKIELFVEHKSDQNTPIYPKIKPSGTILTQPYDAQAIAKYRVKNISVTDISTPNDVVIQIRAAKNNSNTNVWSDWQNVQLATNESGEIFISNDIVFNGYRFLQAQILLKTPTAYIGIDHIDLEVIN